MDNIPYGPRMRQRKTTDEKLKGAKGLSVRLDCQNPCRHHAQSHSVNFCSTPLLDALDHFLHQVDGDPEFEQTFYGATTPGEMVELAVSRGILIEGDDFRALLRSGSTEFWLVRGGGNNNPIAHLQQVFRV